MRVCVHACVHELYVEAQGQLVEFFPFTFLLVPGTKFGVTSSWGKHFYLLGNLTDPELLYCIRTEFSVLEYLHLCLSKQVSVGWDVDGWQSGCWPERIPALMSGPVVLAVRDEVLIWGYEHLLWSL